jgi:hypothetical protein
LSQPLRPTLSSVLLSPDSAGCCCPPVSPSSGARLVSPPRFESTASADSVILAVSLPSWTASGGARLLPPPRSRSTTFVASSFPRSPPGDVHRSVEQWSIY